MLKMRNIVTDFAIAFKAIDDCKPRGRSKTREYQAGIGPLTEDEAVSRALVWLRETKSDYSEAGPRPYPGSRQKCESCVAGTLGHRVETDSPVRQQRLKAEHWSENILHPYPRNVGAVGDAMKLNEPGFSERKGILVFGHEHSPARINLDTAVSCLALICGEVVGICLSTRCSASFPDLIHPSHQHGKVFGGEIFSSS